MTVDALTVLHGDALELDDTVEVGSTALDVRFARSEDGATWVAKLPLMGKSELIAEGAGWLLSRLVGACVPEACGLWCDEQGRWWALSRYVKDVSHWTPDMIDRIANSEALGRAFAVDGVVWNEDRHAKNILVAHDQRGATAVAIDFGAALIGHPASLELKPIGPPTRRRADMAVGLARDTVFRGVLEGVARLASLDEGVLAEVSREATRHVSSSERDTLQRVLEERCRDAQACNSDLGDLSGWP